MTRETLLKRLVRLRELKLRAEVGELKERAGALEEIERLIEQTRAGADLSMESPAMLAELGALGEIRLKSHRRAADVGKEVALLKQKVWRTRKLADAARDASGELGRRKRHEQERNVEIEAEHFLGWKKPLDRGNQ